MEMRIDSNCLVVTYSSGSEKRFDLKELAHMWFNNSNDDFHSQHGFDWPFELLAHPGGVRAKQEEREKVELEAIRERARGERQAVQSEGKTIFISYSHQDKETVNELIEVMRDLGLKFFLDEKDVSWGDTITHQVRDALNGCSAVVVVLSIHSLRSGWVPFEVGHAMGAEKRILPFLVEPDLPLPGYLADTLYMSDLTSVVAYFQSESWSSFLEEVEDPSEKVTKSIATNAVLGELLGLIWQLDDTWVKYATTPPTASLEEYDIVESDLKELLFKNKLALGKDLYGQMEGIILKIRKAMVIFSQMASIRGGDGRPTADELEEHHRELLKDIKRLDAELEGMTSRNN